MHVGKPSVFLRTFGCPFRCVKFGLKEHPGKYNPEVQEIVNNIDNYKSFEELPLVKTGCDSYAAVYPEFKRFAKDYDIDTLVDVLLNLTPNGSWIQNTGQDIHLVITGGEPLLGWQNAYVELFKHPRMADLRNVTFETNTTQGLRSNLDVYLRCVGPRLTTTWSCSPKLPSSGEPWDKAIRPEIAAAYRYIPDSRMYFKFVVSNSEDIEYVKKAVEEYRQADVRAPVYLMPVGGCKEEYETNRRFVAETCLKEGYIFSPRLHVDIWGNAWST